MRYLTIACVPLFALSACAMGQGLDARDEPNRLVLSNERLSLAIGKEHKGGLVSLADFATGREFMAASPQRILLLVLTQRAGDGKERIYVSNHDAGDAQYALQQDGQSRTAQVTLRDLGGRGIHCRFAATVRADDPLVYWRLEEVTVPESLVLEEVHFPVVMLGVPDDAGAEEALVIGHTKGGVYRRPGEWEVNKGTSAYQPGSMAAQFGCYYDPQVGLYEAAYDDAGYPKSLGAIRRAEGLEITWRHPCFAQESFGLQYDVVMSTFSGADTATPTDWRDAADIYKAWAEQQHWCEKTFARREDIPDWLKSGPAMVRFGRGWLATPELIRRWFSDYWQKHFSADIPLIVAYWGWEKVASWVTPDYFPVFPSDEEFMALAKMNRESGAHVFPWPSGHRYTLTFNAHEDGSFEWDDRERFSRDFSPHAVRNRDGSVYSMKPSWLQGGENSCICPGDPFGIDWFDNICVELTRRGADMVQVDQIVGGSFPPCYSEDHGHPPGPGRWMTDVFRAQLISMTRRMREIDPEAVACFEEPNEHFIQQAAVQDYRDIESRRRTPKPELASVFNYLYHEYLPTFQSNPGGQGRLMQLYCLVNGQIPHMVPSSDIGPGLLLGNGDFEEWVQDKAVGWDKVDGWQGRVWRGSFARDEEDKHAGESSLRLENTRDDDVVQVSRNLPFRGQFHAGGTYRLSVWMKSEGLAKPNGINLGALTGELQSKGGWRIDMPPSGAGWVRGEATFTVPEGADYLRIMMHVEGPGRVWVDDMRLEQVAADGTLSELMRPDVPPDHDIMARWVELFSKQGRPYLLHGRMLHPPKLQCATTTDGGQSFPAILHNAYRAADGSEAVVMANATSEPQNGTLHWGGEEIPVELKPWEIVLHRSR